MEFQRGVAWLRKREREEEGGREGGVAWSRKRERKEEGGRCCVVEEEGEGGWQCRSSCGGNKCGGRAVIGNCGCARGVPTCVQRRCYVEGVGWAVYGSSGCFMAVAQYVCSEERGYDAEEQHRHSL